MFAAPIQGSPNIKLSCISTNINVAVDINKLKISFFTCLLMLIMSMDCDLG